MTIPFTGIDLLDIVVAFGYVGFFIVVWAESGFFLGVVLPGDSLLFLLGVLASQDIFNVWILIPTLILAAILGDNFGYWFGKKLGPRLFSKEDARFFKKSYLDRTNAFYEKYGAKTIIIGRFLPVVRTFAPILAGACGMKYSLFLRYNVLGAFLWVLSIVLAGYFLGSLIPGVDQFLIPIVGAIILFSFVPAFFEYMRNRIMKKARS
jgi:membrane-associated protein